MPFSASGRKDRLGLPSLHDVSHPLSFSSSTVGLQPKTASIGFVTQVLELTPPLIKAIARREVCKQSPNGSFVFDRLCHPPWDVPPLYYQSLIGIIIGVREILFRNASIGNIPTSPVERRQEATEGSRACQRRRGRRRAQGSFTAALGVGTEEERLSRLPRDPKGISEIFLKFSLGF